MSGQHLAGTGRSLASAGLGRLSRVERLPSSSASTSIASVRNLAERGEGEPSVVSAFIAWARKDWDLRAGRAECPTNARGVLAGSCRRQPGDSPAGQIELSDSPPGAPGGKFIAEGWSV